MPPLLVSEARITKMLPQHSSAMIRKKSHIANISCSLGFARLQICMIVIKKSCQLTYIPDIQRGGIKFSTASAAQAIA